jgi:choline dehydrogenase
VLLIEAGGNDDYLWIHIPVGYLYCIGNPRTDWLYFTEPDAGPERPQAALPARQGAGRLQQHQRHDLHARPVARLRRLGRRHRRRRWRWDDCLPYFKRHEDHWRGADAAHGAPGFDPKGDAAGGEWRVEQQRLSWEILDAFAAAAQEAGIPATDDFNRGNNEGVGYFEVNQRKGMRWNATKAFLRPARHRPNLQVWTGAQVARLIFERGRHGLRAPASRCCRVAGAGGAPLIAQADDGGSEVVVCRRRHRHAADPAAVGHRPGCAAAAARHQRGARPARRRREPAGPPADPRRVRVQGVKHAEHPGQQLVGQGLIGLEYLLRAAGR